MPAGTVLIFSYGSLQKKSVQLANFGRELAGRSDALPGHVRVVDQISDPGIAALIGETYYATAVATSNPEDSLPGMVFEVSEEELESADKYETAAKYRRISVTLRSAAQAWVYVRT